MGIISLKSNLAINGTPDRYDTQGQLINFPKAGSQLDIDSVPEKYDRLGKLDKLPPEASQLNFDGNLPAPANGFLNTNALGFTIKNPVGISQYIDGGQTSIYGYPGTLPSEVNNILDIHAKGFTIRNPIGVSRFVGINGSTFTNPNGNVINTSAGIGIDFMPNIYAKGFTIKNPIGVTQFVGVNGTTFTNPNGSDINTTPGPGVDFFISKAAKGFTIKNGYGESQFIGINGNTYTNPTGNILGAVNYFPDETSGAKGFKTKLAPYESGFIGISSDNTKYQYPETVYGARLLNVTLGPSGGTAKLENQLGAGSKMGNKGFYAENRYAEAVRNDSNQSLLTSWSLRRRSPSPLEQQYSKFKLREEAFNPTYIAHPLILRGIQNPDVLNPQRWGIDALGQQEGRTAANNLAAALDGGFIRGGASTAAERAAIDTVRLAKFMASPKGIVWVATQVGLGKSNPLVEKNSFNVLPFNDTRSHLGLSTLLSVPGSAFGTHITRHGIPFANELASYEKVITSRINEARNNENRLIKIKKELFGTPNPSSPAGLLGAFQQLSNFVKGSDNPIIQTISGLGGPGSVYGIGSTNIRRYTNSRNFSQDDTVTSNLIQRAGVSGDATTYYNSYQRSSTTHLGNPAGSTAAGVESDRKSDLQKLLVDKTKDTNYNPGTFNGDSTQLGKVSYSAEANKTDGTNKSGNKHSVLPYNQIRNIARDRNSKSTAINDFRANLDGETKTFSTSTDNINFTEGNLSKRYGFGDQGNPNADRSNPYVRTSIDGASPAQDRGNIDSALEDIKTIGKFGISNTNGFRGDKITAIDYIKSTSQNEIYPEGVRDFIKFYFSGIDLYDTGRDNVIVFRSNIQNLADSFSPSWSTVSIIGRPDGPAIYSSFERNISFNFTVAATSREELVPMWRKLNYLATFTMPVYGGGKPGGALCRMTIGDLFNNTPGYFTGLTIGVNEESSWDLADDSTIDRTNTIRTKKNKYSKQLPTIVDVDVQFKIIHDWRPQQGGRAYHLYNGNYTPASQDGSWLWDSNI
jgi:hypothetical protein